MPREQVPPRYMQEENFRECFESSYNRPIRALVPARATAKVIGSTSYRWIYELTDCWIFELPNQDCHLFNNSSIREFNNSATRKCISQDEMGKLNCPCHSTLLLRTPEILV
jgi:hypothetical protein